VTAAAADAARLGLLMGGGRDAAARPAGAGA